MSNPIFTGMMAIGMCAVIICVGVMLITDRKPDKPPPFQYMELNGYTVTMVISEESKEDIVVCLMKNGKGFGMSYNPELVMVGKSEIRPLPSAKENKI